MCETPARITRRVDPSRMQTPTAMHEVHRGAGCTRILQSSPVLRLRHFFLEARAPEKCEDRLSAE